MSAHLRQAWATRIAGGTLPSGLYFTRKSGTVRVDGITAWDREVPDPRGFPEGHLVGELTWTKDTGEIAWVAVYDDEYKRRGIATWMFARAKEIEPRLHHSTELSESGKAWSRTVATRRFEPGQVATWARTRPWDAPRADLESGVYPGIRVGQARGTEVASFEGGMVVLKDEWFGYPPGSRRAVLYHEAGHGLETAVGQGVARYFGVENPLDVIDLPGAQRFGHDYGEVVAEGYAVLWTEPSWAGSFDGGRAVLEAVRAMARDHGYPLP